MNKKLNLRSMMMNHDFVPLSEDKEGHLLGGFTALASAVNNCNCRELDNNCACNNNNCSCPPDLSNNCTCQNSGSTSNNCNCYTTIKPPATTSAPTSAVTTATVGLFGAWAGIM